MNAELWTQVERITAEALEKPSAERERYACQEAGGNVELLRAVLDLLDADQKMGSDYLESPVFDFTRESFGQYRALREIGRGGMSVVYLGERAGGEFERQAAIKILLAGGVITQDETRILASLEHANIARLFDAGVTASGFRYLVMEYVEGAPIHQYCVGLDETRRLRLFLQICAGVQHANRSLIVHRDLKPANILVTRQGVVKLLDFGIAKMLSVDAGEDLTTGARAWTPDYASPEQILGAPVTTSTDVYSLGVLLCELIGGERPRRFAGLPLAEVVRRAASEETGEVPLKGDLALIARKALARDPSQRYDSAGAMAQDIERYLARRPVLARPPSLGYRARKFVVRNRYTVAAVSLAAAALIVTTGIAVWQARLASERFLQVRGLAHSVLFELYNAIEPLPNSLAARKLLAKRSLQYLDALAADTRADSAMRLELVEGYLQLATIEGISGQASLGDSSAALSHLAKASALARGVLAAEPGNVDATRWLAEALRSTASGLSLRGDATKAAEAARESLELAEWLRSASTATKGDTEDYAESLHVLARALSHSRADAAKSLPVMRKLIEVRRELLAANPTSDILRRDLGRSLQELAVVCYRQGDLAATEEAARESYRINRQRLETGNKGAMLQLSTDIGYLAAMAWKRDDFRASLPLLEEQLRLRQQMAAQDNKDAHMARRIGATLSRLGFTYARLGRFDDAVRTGRDALARLRASYAGDPSNTENSRELFFALLDLGESYHRAGRKDPACALAPEAERYYNDLMRKALSMEKGPSERLHALMKVCGNATR
jgi:non-specific serine/threonine protein kinase/serine/threonine-protein kinase